MHAHRDLLLSDHITANDCDMFLFVAIVPKCDNPKVAEAGGEIGNGYRPHAERVLAEAGAFVVRVVRHDFLQLLPDDIHRFTSCARIDYQRIRYRMRSLPPRVDVRERHLVFVD
jgi:hypothetical protein